MIKYGISTGYLPDWDYQSALREIYQNFTDYGTFKTTTESRDDGMLEVSLTNDFNPKDFGFLRIGDSGKRGDDTKVGKHGEGLKMAMFVLTRNGRECTIRMRDKIFKGVLYQDEFLGECFGLEPIIATWSEVTVGFQVTFEIPQSEFDRYHAKKVSPAEVIHSTPYGDMIARPPGEVFVAGQYVSTVDGLKYAYNFKPEHIRLDRDRRIPSGFDVDWTASRILSGWKELSVEDLTSRDTCHMSTIPTHVAEQFNPSIVAGQVVFRSKSIQAPSNAAASLMTIPSNQKKIAKMRFNVSKKRTPNSILQEFFDTHRFSSSQAKIDMRILLKKSKSWKA